MIREYFQKRLFEEVSSFYDEGRRNLETRLRRVVTLEQARNIISNEDNYGKFGLYDPKISEEDKRKARTFRSALEKIFLADARGKFLFAPNPYKKPHEEEGEITREVPETVPTGNRSIYMRVIEMQRREYSYHQSSLESVEWQTLRELSEGVIEHGFGRSYNPKRILELKNGQVNLGDHYYRVRRFELEGVVAQVGLPELQIIRNS